MGDDASELQKEWRAIVLDKINKIESTQHELRKDIADIKTASAQATEVTALRSEVDKLKEFKAKGAGIIIGFNSVVAAIAWFISTYFRH